MEATDRVRWQSRKPTSRTQPRKHPRGQPGRCAGSSSRASRWTPPIRRARNASGSVTRDAGRKAAPLQRPTKDLRIAEEQQTQATAPFPLEDAPVSALSGFYPLSGVPPAPLNRSQPVNCLFPQAFVISGSFPRVFTTTIFGPISSIHHDNRPKPSSIHHDKHK